MNRRTAEHSRSVRTIGAKSAKTLPRTKKLVSDNRECRTREISLLSRQNDKIASTKEPWRLVPEHFSDPSFDPVSSNCIANLPADRNPQSACALISGRKEDDEVA